MSIDIQPAYRTVHTKHEDEFHRTLIFESADGGWTWTDIAPAWVAEQIEALKRESEALGVAKRAIQTIESMTVPAGYDFGHAGVARICREALEEMERTEARN